MDRDEFSAEICTMVAVCRMDDHALIEAKVAALYERGRREGIEEAIAAVHTARQFPVSGQPAFHVFDVVEAMRALLEAKS